MTSQLASRDYAVTDSDAALLERLRSGDSTAFEELFLRHYAAVYRVLYGVVGNAQEAEDLAQETFTALYRQPPRLDGSGGLGAWLYRVAVNRAYNALRSKQRLERRLGWMEPEQQSDPQDEYLRREERERVQAALARLPERTAKLLLLRHAGLAYAEIAAALQVAPGSVGTLLVRAEERARVRAALARLPERQGKLLLLRYAGLSYAEIAAIVEVAPGSIGTLLSRAERAFLTEYKQMEPDHAML